MKYEEDVEDGGECWFKFYVVLFLLYFLFEFWFFLLMGVVMLDMDVYYII